MNKEVKRPSDFLKSMDEVKAYADSIKDKVPEDIYEDILFLLGLEDNNALTEKVLIDNIETDIDCYIVELVKYLDEKGYKPMASCSGLQEEHQNSKHKPKQGYLAIEYSHMFFKYLFDFFGIEGITIDKSECFLKPCITFTVKAETDEEMKRLWDELFEFFRK